MARGAASVLRGWGGLGRASIMRNLMRLWDRMTARFRKPEPAFRDLALSTLYPLFAPKAFAETGWVGPIDALDVEGLDLTWGLVGEGGGLDYFTWAMVEECAAKSLDWRGIASENLGRLAETRPWSHEYKNDNGRMVFVTFLNEDGLGPSRLLVPGLLDQVFPQGYEVAVPELTCAVAVGRVEGAEDPLAEEFIQSCFKDGTRPVSPKRYPPEVFWGR